MSRERRVVLPEPGGECETWIYGVEGRITIGALEVPSFALPDFPVDILEYLT